MQKSYTEHRKIIQSIKFKAFGKILRPGKKGNF